MKKVMILSSILMLFLILSGFASNPKDKGIGYGEVLYTNEFKFSSLGSTGGFRHIGGLSKASGIRVTDTGFFYYVSGILKSKYSTVHLQYSKSGASITYKIYLTTDANATTGHLLYSATGTTSTSMIIQYYEPSSADSDLAAPIVTGTNYYSKKASDALTLETIESNLNIQDANQAWYIVISNNYSGNESKVGKYAIVVKARDHAWNESSPYTINIDVVADDPGTTEPPVITGPTHHVTSGNNPITIDEIKATLKALDSTGKNLTINIIKDDYTPNHRKVGIHEIIFQAKDAKGNETTFKVTVNVQDSSFPVINGPDALNVNIDVPMTLQQIIAGNFTASDDVDGNMTSKIKIDLDEYSANTKKVGSYKVTLSVTDAAGNKTSRSTIITVQDLSKPVISGSIATITATPNKPFNINAFKETLQVTDNYDKLTTSNIYIKSDDYTPNANRLGVYTIIFAVKDTSGNEGIFTKIIEIEADKEVPPDKPGEDNPDDNPKDTDTKQDLSVFYILGGTLVASLIVLFILLRKKGKK